MTVRILWFAWLRDVTKTPAIDLSFEDGATVDDAFREVIARWPDLDAQLFRLPIVLDGKVVDASAPLRHGAELVWLPPVGGGAPEGQVVRAELTREPLDPARLVSEVTAANCGGIATFIGVVRDHDGGRKVVALTYDAYDSLAGSQLQSVAGEASRRWPDARIAVQHRTGRLVVGDASVAIAVACPHREEAFACCRFVIDRVKEAVPIWKREESEDGARWLEGHAYRPEEKRNPGASRE
jgi:molybdopterin synthase catalytic subunit/molybdopterin converting factor small subunit